MIAERRWGPKHANVAVRLDRPPRWRRRGELVDMGRIEAHQLGARGDGVLLVAERALPDRRELREADSEPLGRLRRSDRLVDLREKPRR